MPQPGYRELLAPSAYKTWCRLYGNPPNQNEWVIGLVMDVRMECFPFPERYTIWKHFGDFQVKFGDVPPKMQVLSKG